VHRSSSTLSPTLRRRQRADVGLALGANSLNMPPSSSPRCRGFRCQKVTAHAGVIPSQSVVVVITGVVGQERAYRWSSLQVSSTMGEQDGWEMSCLYAPGLETCTEIVEHAAVVTSTHRLHNWWKRPMLLVLTAHSANPNLGTTIHATQRIQKLIHGLIRFP